MLSRFDNLIQELGDALGIPLEKDKFNAIRLNIDEKISVQIEPREEKESLLVASFITEVAPGKAREYTLRDALIANDEFPRVGTLGYSAKNNKLALFEYVPIDELTGEKLADRLSLFVEKVFEWKESIEGGAPSPISTAPKRKGNGGMYGLKS